MFLATRVRSELLAISVVLAACESASVREIECTRIHELSKPRRTWTYAKQVRLTSMEWTDPEIRAAVDRLERNAPDCVEVARQDGQPVLQCPKTLAQICGGTH